MFVVWCKWPDSWSRHWLKVWEMKCNTIACREQIQTPVKIGRWGKKDKGRFQISFRKRRETWHQPWVDSFKSLFSFSPMWLPFPLAVVSRGLPHPSDPPSLDLGATSMFMKAFCHHLVQSQPHQPPQRRGMPKFFCKYVVRFWVTLLLKRIFYAFSDIWLTGQKV